MVCYTSAVGIITERQGIIMEEQGKKQKRNRDFLVSLMSYTEALRPIIYVENCFESREIDPIIIKMAGSKAKIIEYNSALGMVDFKTKSPLLECDLESFLRKTMDYGYPEDEDDEYEYGSRRVFLVLRDTREELCDRKVTALLKIIAERNFRDESYYCTVLIISSKIPVPEEIEEFITIMDYPLPKDSEIIDVIKDFKDDYSIDISEQDIDEISLSFKGLNSFQIRQILGTAYQQKGGLNIKDKDLILKEKKQFIKKSGMLEIINVKEKVDDIGGLEVLKKWLVNKAKVFNHLDQALKYKVDTPKGVMILGMPGCGKSLTAKVTAVMFEVPLVRLDIGRLLGKYVGESEGNMRKALQLAEAISPCVLWIDELEKAFAGVGGSGGSDITTRLFGQFLTWMQEKENTVFIVATANDISNIPPEFLRKGRFDDIFFVDLPTKEERKKIFEIHCRKRGINHFGNKETDVDIEKLVSKTQDYNGADIEGVVKEVVEKSFVNDKSAITTNSFTEVISNTKSIKQTLGKKIESIKNAVKDMDIRSASMTE